MRLFFGLSNHGLPHRLSAAICCVDLKRQPLGPKFDTTACFACDRLDTSTGSFAQTAIIEAREANDRTVPHCRPWGPVQLRSGSSPFCLMLQCARMTAVWEFSIAEYLHLLCDRPRPLEEFDRGQLWISPIPQVSGPTSFRANDQRATTETG